MAETAELLLQQGQRARQEQRPHDAHTYYTGAVALCRQGNDAALLALALKRLGVIERDLGNTAAALALYEEAVSIQRTLTEQSALDPPALAHTIRHAADILRGSSQYKDALPLYEEALALYRSHAEANTLDLANTLRGFALLKSALGEKAAAIAFWQEAGTLYSQVWQEPGSPFTQADLQPGIDESQRQVALLSAD